MEKLKPVLPYIVVFLAGVLILGLYAFKVNINEKNFIGAHRVIIAMAAAAVSIALPGILTIGKPPEIRATEINPQINAGGALAVFVIVYLFNPVSFN